MLSLWTPVLSPQATCTSVQLSYSLGVPPTQVLKFPITAHKTQENTAYLYWFIKKDSQMEEMHGTRDVGWGMELPRPLWAHYPLNTSESLLTGKLPEPHRLGVLWRFHYIGMMD